MSQEPLKVAAAKRSFQNVYIIDTTSFDECFLFHVITGSERHYLVLISHIIIYYFYVLFVKPN